MNVHFLFCVAVLATLLDQHPVEGENNFCASVHAYGPSCASTCPLYTARHLQMTNSVESHLVDCVCEVGFFSLTGGGVACSPCPDGARCDGGVSLPRARRGFWSASTEQYFPCNPWYACTETLPHSNNTVQCREGLSGVKCEKIQTQYRTVGSPTAYVLHCDIMKDFGIQVGGDMWIDAWTIVPCTVILAFWAFLGWVFMHAGATSPSISASKKSKFLSALFAAHPLDTFFGAQLAFLALRLPVRWPLFLKPFHVLAGLVLIDVSVWSPCGGWFNAGAKIGGVALDRPLGASFFPESHALAASSFGKLLRAQTLSFTALVVVIPILRVILMGAPCRRNGIKKKNKNSSLATSSELQNQKAIVPEQEEQRNLENNESNSINSNLGVACTRSQWIIWRAALRSGMEYAACLARLMFPILALRCVEAATCIKLRHGETQLLSDLSSRTQCNSSLHLAYVIESTAILLVAAILQILSPSTSSAFGRNCVTRITSTIHDIIREKRDASIRCLRILLRNTTLFCCYIVVFIMSSIFTPFFLLSVAASLSIVSEYALQHPAISAVSFAFFAMVIGVQSLFRVDGAPQSHITKEIATARGIITGFVAISYFSSVRFSFISSVPAYASLSATYSKKLGYQKLYVISNLTAVAAGLTMAISLSFLSLISMIRITNMIRERRARHRLLWTAFKVSKRLLFPKDAELHQGQSLRQSPTPRASSTISEQFQDETDMVTLEIDLIRLEASIAAATAAGVYRRKKGEQLFLNIDVHEPSDSPTTNHATVPKVHRTEVTFNFMPESNSAKPKRDRLSCWTPSTRMTGSKNIDGESLTQRNGSIYEPIYIDVPRIYRGLLSVHFTVTNHFGEVIALWDATLPHSKHSRAMRQKRDSKLTGKKGAADSIDSTNLEFIYDVIELFGAHGRKSFLTTAWRRYRNFDRHFSWLLHLRIGYTTPAAVNPISDEDTTVRNHMQRERLLKYLQMQMKPLGVKSKKNDAAEVDFISRSLVRALRSGIAVFNPEGCDQINARLLKYYRVRANQIGKVAATKIGSTSDVKVDDWERAHEIEGFTIVEFLIDLGLFRDEMDRATEEEKRSVENPKILACSGFNLFLRRILSSFPLLPYEMSRTMGGSFGYALEDQIRVVNQRSNRIMTTEDRRMIARLFYILREIFNEKHEYDQAALSDEHDYSNPAAVLKNTKFKLVWSAVRPEMRGILAAAFLSDSEFEGASLDKNQRAFVAFQQTRAVGSFSQRQQKVNIAP